VLKFEATVVVVLLGAALIVVVMVIGKPFMFVTSGTLGRLDNPLGSVLLRSAACKARDPAEMLPCLFSDIKT